MAGMDVPLFSLILSGGDMDKERPQGCVETRSLCLLDIKHRRTAITNGPNRRPCAIRLFSEHSWYLYLFGIRWRVPQDHNSSGSLFEAQYQAIVNKISCCD